MPNEIIVEINFKMKNILLIILFSLNSFLSHAQGFYYINPGNGIQKIIKTELLKASQFVLESLIVSDYTIIAGVNFQDENNSLALNISLIDSITNKTIYQANEKYLFGIRKPESK